MRALLQRRVFVLLGLVLVVVAAGLVDAVVDRSANPQHPANPAAPDASALSSAWYCAATPALKSAPDSGVVVIFNPTDVAVTGTATFMGTASKPVDAPFAVPARSRVQLRPADVTDAPLVSTLLRVDGGGVAVEHVVAGNGAVAFAPCSSNTASQWYFADGSTAATATMQLALFNPFEDAAVVDLTFVTSEGRAAPGDFSGIVVAPQSLVVIDVGEHLRRREWVTTNVDARRGRLVVDQLQGGSSVAPQGFSVTLGSPEESNSWYFANGSSAAGLTDRISLYNPGDREAEVRLQLVSETGETPEPFDLHVPANGRIAETLSGEDRVPKNVRYSVSIRSTNGLGVVASRNAFGAESGAVPSSSMITGAESPWRHWALPFGRTVESNEESVFIFNPGSSPATVQIQAMVDGVALPVGQPVRVEPNRRVSVTPNDASLLPLVDPSIYVASDEPVVVSRELAAPGEPSASSLAVPLR